MNKLKVRLHSLLRWSEKYFKTDMVYLARGGFWLIFLQVLSALSSFILAIGFAHFLSKEVYGTYKYIMSVGGILMAFSLTGLSTVVTNAAARGQDGTLGFAFKKNLSWSTLTILIFAATAGYYFTHGNSLLAWGLLIIGIISPLLGSTSLSDAYFVGKKDFRRSALTSAAALLFINITTLGAAYISSSILILIGTYMLSSLVAEIVIYTYAVRTYTPHNGAIDPNATTYGAHLSLMGIFNIFVDRLDSVLTFHFLGPVELAIYSFAIAIPEQLKGVAKSVSSLALPRFSENDPSAVYKGIGRKMWVMGVAVTFVILLYVIFAPLIFTILFPQYKSPSTFPSQIYIISLIAVVNTLPITYLQAVAAKKELYLFNIVGGIAQIVLMTAGVMLYGLMGLVVSIGMSRFFRLWYSVYLMHKKHSTLTHEPQLSS